MNVFPFRFSRSVFRPVDVVVHFGFLWRVSTRNGTHSKWSPLSASGPDPPLVSDLSRRHPDGHFPSHPCGVGAPVRGRTVGVKGESGSKVRTFPIYFTGRSKPPTDLFYPRTSTLVHPLSDLSSGSHLDST